MSIIFVDQTCGLSESDAKKVGLELLRWNNETEIENQFGDAFKEAMALDEDIIYLHPARKLSTQVAVAINFKRTQTVNYKNKFLLIDCGTIGMGYGLCAYMLGIQNKNYKSTSEQIEYLEHNKFAVLRYSSATGTLNSPIYKIFDGVEEKVGVASGINSAKNKIVELIRAQGANIFDYYVFVCGENAQTVADIAKRLNTDDRVITYVAVGHVLEVAFHV